LGLFMIARPLTRKRGGTFTPLDTSTGQRCRDICPPKTCHPLLARRYCEILCCVYRLYCSHLFDIFFEKTLITVLLYNIDLNAGGGTWHRSRLSVGGAICSGANVRTPRERKYDAPRPFLVALSDCLSGGITYFSTAQSWRACMPWSDGVNH